MAIVGTGIVIALGIFCYAYSTDAPASRAPTTDTIHPGVPEAPLLQDVLTIQAWWHTNGVANFTAVPGSRPPGLIGLNIGGDGAAVSDVYHSTSGISSIVIFSSQKMNVCDDEVDGIQCIRQESLASAPGGVDSSTVAELREGGVNLNYLTIYLSSDGVDDSNAKSRREELVKFWKAADFVSPSDAAWLRDLEYRAATSARDD